MSPTEGSAPPPAPKDAAHHLAEVLLDGCMGRPLQTLLPPTLCAELGRAVALAVLRDPQADVRLAQGLTLAQSFVQQHQGTIECDSRPGWTCFTIHLPLELLSP